MKAKHILILMFISSNLFAQTANWSWAKTFGRVSFHEYCNSMCTDPNGNSYITGTFQDTLIIGNDTLANTGSYGSILYLAKIDSTGNPLWAIIPSDNNMSEANALALDEGGHVYMTGFYRGTMTFGNVSLTTMGGWGQTFTVKFDSNGNALWGHKAVSNHENTGFGIDVNSDNDVYITGVYDSSVTFGGVQLNGSFLGSNIFVVKYDGNGNLIWAKGTPAGINTKCTGISCDDNNNACITGSFRNTITFDTITLTGPSNGTGTVFTVKYDGNGNVLWAKSSGGFPSSGFGESISSDAAGNFYIAGYFNSAIMIFGADTLVNAGINDLFLVKYDSLGNLQYAIGEGGTDFDQANFVVADANGNCYVTGFFKGSISFGPTYLYGPNQELFVTKYDPYGVPVWAKSATGGLNEVGYGLGIDAFNNVYVGGRYSSPTTDFGPHTIVNTDPWTGSYDFYVAKLNEQTTTSIAWINPENEFNIYPNPSNGIIRFERDLKENGIIQIINVEGRIVRQFNLSGQSQIDVRDLQAGIYQLRVIENGLIQRGRVAIVH